MLYYFQFVAEETEVQHGCLLSPLVVFITGIYFQVCLIAKLKIWIVKALVPIPPSTWSHSSNPRGSPLLLCPCEMGPQHLGSSEVRRDKTQYVLKGCCDSPDSIMWKGSAQCPPIQRAEIQARTSPDSLLHTNGTFISSLGPEQGWKCVSPGEDAKVQG